MGAYICLYVGIGFFFCGYVSKDAEGTADEEKLAPLLWVAILLWPLVLLFGAGHRLRKMLG